MSDSLAGKHVLVLEDEPLIAMVLADTLHDAGCSVIGPAHDVEQALKLIDAGRLDAAVLDVNLGAGITSAPVVDSLKARGIPFVFATGYGEKGLRDCDRGYPRVDKPYRTPVLLKTLASALAGSAYGSSSQ